MPLIDTHTNIWDVSLHMSEKFLEETRRARTDPTSMDVTPERFAAAIKPCDNVIAFGLRFAYTGIDVPDYFVVISAVYGTDPDYYQLIINQRAEDREK